MYLEDNTGYLHPPASTAPVPIAFEHLYSKAFPLWKAIVFDDASARHGCIVLDEYATRSQREPGPLNEVEMLNGPYAAFFTGALVSAKAKRIAPGPPLPNVTVNCRDGCPCTLPRWAVRCTKPHQYQSAACHLDSSSRRCRRPA